MLSQPSDTHPGAHIDFARKRLQLGESLYFKTLESIVLGEKKRLSSPGRDPKEKVDLTVGDSLWVCAGVEGGDESGNDSDDEYLIRACSALDCL